MGRRVQHAFKGFAYLSMGTSLESSIDGRREASLGARRSAILRVARELWGWANVLLDVMLGRNGRRKDVGWTKGITGRNKDASSGRKRRK